MLSKWISQRENGFLGREHPGPSCCLPIHSICSLVSQDNDNKLNNIVALHTLVPINRFYK